MWVRLLLLLSWSLISVAPCLSAASLDPAHVAVFFANPYPLSPGKVVRSKIMTLWSETREALTSDDTINYWRQHKQSECVETVLELSSLVDLLTMRVTDTMQDTDHLQSVMVEIEKNIYQLTQDVVSEEVGCLKIVIDRIKKKMEQIFSTCSTNKTSGYIVLLFKRCNTVVCTNHQLT